MIEPQHIVRRSAWKRRRGDLARFVARQNSFRFVLLVALLNHTLFGIAAVAAS